MIEPLGVTSERLFQFGLVEPLEDAAHRRVGWRPPQRRTREGCVQKAEPPVDQGMDLPIRARAAHHRQDRARIENRITPACPYIFPSARRRSGMVARQVRRSVVMSNLRVGLLPMDSDRLPLRKRKDVLHGAVRAAALRQSVEQPWAHNYPMVAPNYAAARSNLAKQFGLGARRRQAEPVQAEPEPVAPPTKGRRRKKAA